jgi:plastocyanin
MIAASRSVRLRRLLIACVALTSITLAACGDGDDATSGTTTSTTAAAGGDAVDLSDKEFEDLTDQTEVSVQSRDNAFLADYIIVKAGTTVTWTNRGRTEHNVLPAVDGAFAPIEVQDLEPGMSASITFDEPGDYPYYCSLHGTRTKGMVGAVRVVA